MRFKIPREGIRWIVGRYNVSMSDAEVEKDIRRRCDEWPISSRPTEKQRQQIVQFALRCHARNVKLFLDIARGNLR